MSTTQHKLTSPSSVLNKYKQYLSNQGAIKSSEEAVWFSSLMPKVINSIERCIFLQIIGATASHANPPIIVKFLNSGGWNTLDSWFSEYLEAKNTGFLNLMMEILNKLPITIQMLRNVTIAKSVKRATKLSDTKLKQASKALIKRWKSFVLESKSNSETKVTLEKENDDIKVEKFSPIKRHKSSQDEVKFKNVKEQPVNSFLKSLDRIDNMEDSRKVTPIQSTQNETVEETNTNNEYVEDPISEEYSIQSELIEEEYSNSASGIEVNQTPSPSIIPKKRKSISWKSDDQLVTIKYFEKDEPETNSTSDIDTCGENVNNSEGGDSSLKTGTNNENIISWNTLIHIEHDPNAHITSFGSSSNEKVLQSKWDVQFSKILDSVINPHISNENIQMPTDAKEPEGDDLGAGIMPIQSFTTVTRPFIRHVNPHKAPFGGYLGPRAAVPVNNSDRGHRYPARSRGRTFIPNSRYGGNPRSQTPYTENNSMPLDANQAHFQPRPHLSEQPTCQFQPRPHLNEQQTSQFQPPAISRGRFRYMHTNTRARGVPIHSSNYSAEGFHRGMEWNSGYASRGRAYRPIQNFQPDLNFSQNPNMNTNYNPNQNPNHTGFVKTIKCRVHSAGAVCRFGDNCRFIHDEPNDKPPV